MQSSPLFTNGLLLFFSVALDAARFFWNVPYTNCRSCFYISLGMKLGAWRNSFAFASTFKGHFQSANRCRVFPTLYLQLPPFVQRKKYVHNYCVVPDRLPHTMYDRLRDELPLLQALCWLLSSMLVLHITNILVIEKESRALIVVNAGWFPKARFGLVELFQSFILKSRRELAV